MINRFIEENKDNILSTICELIKIPSISIENENDSKNPFGEECTKALNYTLDLAKSMGFKTKNIDGYCGYIEFGEGDEMLGIIGHLDVVPAGDGWTKCKPFEPIIEDDKLYGRGAIDDKGPVVASLYAMKYVMDTMNVHKRVRLIIGLNEEVSWKCIEYYKSHEELPTIGFSPDADFPCIYAEKGFLNAYIDGHIPSTENIKINSLTCDNAINIVPKYAECELCLCDIDLSTFESEIYNIVSENNFHIKMEKINDTKVKLISTGVAAHSAHPDLGVNALSRLLILLNRIFDLYNINIPILKYVDEKINTTFNGELLDMNCEDESGNLTINISNLKFENDNLTIGLNLRIPVTIYPTIIKQKIADSTIDYGDVCVKFSDEKPALHVPKNDFLVTTLCDVFNEVTGQNAEPITCNGATYARAFKNVVSFGCNMPGHVDLCHQADEYIEISNLLTAVEIYIKAIWKLTSD
ncbi:MAG: dipeptidase PepV [Clostridia bacterium]|nr:dipeptidase PepV [Clostridia bacterium]